MSKRLTPASRQRVDEIFGFFELRGAPGFEEFVGAAEGAGAKGKYGDF